jgi:hypothetical protein
MESRPLLGTLEPARMPGAKISLLSAPRGWQSGGTSWDMTLDVNPRPPRLRYSSGIEVISYVFVSKWTLRILAISFLLEKFFNHVQVFGRMVASSGWFATSMPVIAEMQFFIQSFVLKKPYRPQYFRSSIFFEISRC